MIMKEIGLMVMDLIHWKSENVVGGDHRSQLPVFLLSEYNRVGGPNSGI